MSDEERDPNKIRDFEIRRLRILADHAYENSINKSLRIGVRNRWHQRYTNHVLALNVLLKDSQIKDYEKRMRIIEEHAKKLAK